MKRIAVSRITLYNRRMLDQKNHTYLRPPWPRPLTSTDQILGEILAETGYRIPYDSRR